MIVTEYDPQWPILFEQLKNEIWPVVQPFAHFIEHVGSTSVPGLPAKPIIDVDVVVKDSEATELAIRALHSVGYIHRGNLGVKGREAFHNPQGQRWYHLYVCLAEGEAFLNHLIFRDYLRKDSNARDRYGQLKQRLAQQFPQSIDLYIEGKTPFILEILAQQGFAEEFLEAIRVLNLRSSSNQK